MKCLIPILLLIPLLLPARTWTDSKGRELNATVHAIDSQSLVLRKLNGETVTVPVSKLSQQDQLIVAFMHEYKDSAIRVKAKVFQVTESGSLCEIYITTKERRNVRVRKHYSKLNKSWSYETRPQTVEVDKLMHDLAFVSELTSVSDGDTVELILWEYGSYRYLNQMNTTKSVPWYTEYPLAQIAPPEDEENFGK